MRQLPPSLSVNADPNNLVKALEDEEGDLVTPVQQKILKRILKNQVTPKQEPATTPRGAPKREFETPYTIPFKVSRKKEPTVQVTPSPPPPPTPAPPPFKGKKFSKRSDGSLWGALPFAEVGIEPDLEGAVTRTLKKIKRTRRYVKNLRPAKGWTSWDPMGKRKKKKKKSSLLGSIGSAAKDWVVGGASGSSSSGRTKRRRNRKKKGVWGSVIKPVGSIAQKLIFDDDDET